METFKLMVLDEKKIHFSGPVTYCGVMTPNGSIGFQARHEGFIGTLQPGSEIKYQKPDGQESALSVQWGVLLFRENQCTITLSAGPVRKKGSR